MCIPQIQVEIKCYIQLTVFLLLGVSNWFSSYNSLGDLSHKRFFDSHTLSGLMAMWGLFLYCPCLPVLNGKCGLMVVNPLFLRAVDSNAELMMKLNSSIPKWLSLTHACDFQHPGSPAGPGQPSREARQPFIHFSWKQPLLVINDSVRAEWCFWFDP